MLAIAGASEARARQTAPWQSAQASPAAVAQAEAPPSVAPAPEAAQTAPTPPRAGDASRFVLPSPVQVQIVPSPKTEAELDAEQREHDERAALNERLENYAELLVAVAVLMTLGLVVQAFYLAAGFRGMRRLIEAADRNAVALHRAFVYLADLKWRPEGSSIRIVPTWANSGATATKSMRVTTNWKASTGELAADFAYVYSRPPEPLFLPPHGTAELGGIVIPMRDAEAALTERVFLYIWGRAAYEDMFEGSKPHFVEFCHRVVVSGSPNNLSLAFVQHGLRNATDQDRPIHEPLA